MRIKKARKRKKFEHVRREQDPVGMILYAVTSLCKKQLSSITLMLLIDQPCEKKISSKMINVKYIGVVSDSIDLYRLCVAIFNLIEITA